MPENFEPVVKLANLAYDVDEKSFNIKTAAGSTLDVYIQDQTTPPVEYFLTKKIQDVTLSTSGITSDSTIIPLTSVVGVTIGDFFEIKYVDYDTGVIRYNQSQIYNIVGNNIYLSIPIDFDILDLTKIESSEITSNKLNIDASGGLEIFDITSPNGLNWDITRLMVEMLCDSAPDDAKFGDITALTKGVYFGVKDDLGTDYHLVNIKSNSDFRLTAYDVTYTSRSSPLSAYGISVRKSFGGQDKYGVVIRLDGSINERFFCAVQDDLTDIESFRIKIMGHIVED